MSDDTAAQFPPNLAMDRSIPWAGRQGESPYHPGIIAIVDCEDGAITYYADGTVEKAVLPSDA